MVPLLFSSQARSLAHPLLLLLSPLQTRRPPPRLVPRLRRAATPSASSQIPHFPAPRDQEPPRTVFPGGYKRPEIRVPSLVLRVDARDALGDDAVLGLLDRAVSKSVAVVVLDGGEIYEAACKLKSVVRDRAYFLVSERVDIAAAANASGVVLSDQGLPVIIARSTMMDSRSDSVVLPLVARKVQSPDAALNASNSEGADFLIYSAGDESRVDEVLNSVRENVKIPIFVMLPSYGEDMLVTEASKSLKSGASGLVTSLKDFENFSETVLSSLFNGVYTPSTRT